MPAASKASWECNLPIVGIQPGGEASCREEEFDVAITFEERIMDQLVDDMHSRTQTSMKPLLVLNIVSRRNTPAFLLNPSTQAFRM